MCVRVHARACVCVCGHALRLEEGGVLTDCSIRTQDADETLDFDFSSTNMANRIIILAECLKEAFAELDMSSEVLEVLLSPSPPHFRLTTFGYAGTAQVHFVTTVYVSLGLQVEWL